MMRRVLILVALCIGGYGLTQLPSTQAAHATTAAVPYYIYDFTVSTSGNTVTYYACVVAPTAPSSMFVDVTDSGGGDHRTRGNYIGQNCGYANQYQMSASYTTLSGGSYTFVAATVEDLTGEWSTGPGGQPESVPTSIDAVTAAIYGCPVNFSLPSTQAPGHCNNPSPLPTLTPTPVPTSTATAVPPTATATNTSTPVPPTATKIVIYVLATSTPVPPTATTVPSATATTGSVGQSAATATATATATSTSTPVPSATNVSNTAPIIIVVGASPVPQQATGAVATATPVPPTAATGNSSTNNAPAATATARPHVATAVALKVSPQSMVKPGTQEQITVSYLHDAFISAALNIAGSKSIQLQGVTDSHGRLTLKTTIPSNVHLTQGHASGSVRVQAQAGSWHTIGAFTPQVHVGATEHVTISYNPQTPISTSVSLPNSKPYVLYGLTDSSGHLKLSLPIPSTVAPHAQQAQARIVAFALTTKQNSSKSASFTVSDMVVTVAQGAINACKQVQTVKVAYLPKTKVQLTLRFGNAKPSTLNVTTNGQGTASVPVSLLYQNAANPALVQITAAATAHNTSRHETYSYTVQLPDECQISPSAQLTVG